MKVRPMAVIRELGFCNLNSREEFETLKKFFKDEELKDKYLEEEIELTRKMMPPEYLYHGTGEKYVSSIDAKGLIPKSRLYVHLSGDIETAVSV